MKDLVKNKGLFWKLNQKKNALWPLCVPGFEVVLDSSSQYKSCFHCTAFQSQAQWIPRRQMNSGVLCGRSLCMDWGNAPRLQNRHLANVLRAWEQEQRFEIWELERLIENYIRCKSLFPPCHNHARQQSSWRQPINNMDQNPSRTSLSCPRTERWWW